MSEQTPAQKLGLDQELGALISALSDEDELGMIIRAHIHIENQLTKYVESRLSPSEALNVLDLTYDDRVNLALALKLPDDFKAALNFIGSLRNRFAHQLDAILAKQDANNFANALGQKKIVLRAFEATKKKLEQEASSLKSEQPKERVTIYLLTLWSGIAVTVANAKISEAS